MPVAEVVDASEWNELVLGSQLTSPTHFFSCADRHFKVVVGGETYIAPFREVSLLGARALLSYGGRVDGGVAPLSGYSALSECVSELLALARSEGYDVLNMTVKRYYRADYTSRVAELLAQLSGHVRVMRARVLPLRGGFDYVWRRRFSKKARNLVRKFERCGGEVALLDDPLEHLDEIMEVNLSAPVRQGRPLPPSYTDRGAVEAGLRSRLEEMGEHFRVYAAFLRGRLAAYAYVVDLNGYAYISRFLAHAKYMGYAPSNGLLSAVIEDLCERSVEVVQYGYWSRRHPGLDHFLKQHGFLAGRVEAYYVPLSSRGALALRALGLVSAAAESRVGDALGELRLARAAYRALTSAE